MKGGILPSHSNVERCPVHGVPSSHPCTWIIYVGNLHEMSKEVAHCW